MTPQLEIWVFSGREENFKFIIHFLKCSFIKTQPYSLTLFPFVMLSLFSPFFFIFYIWMCIHINKKLWNEVYISRKSSLDIFMYRAEHAFLYIIIICLVILSVERIWTQRAYTSFPFLFMAPNKNFIKFLFKTMTETNQGIKLTEISELNVWVSFIQPKETMNPLWVKYIIYAFISVHYHPSHYSSIQSSQSSS